MAREPMSREPMSPRAKRGPKVGVKRGVAAGRSAQRACERSSDWRRGAAGSPDPDYAATRNSAGSPDPYDVEADPYDVLVLLAVDVADGVEDAVGGAAAVVGYLDEIVVGELCFVVRQVLEAGKGVIQLFLCEQQAELF
jgi:hypothetical protein